MVKENLEQPQEQLVFNTLQDHYKEMIRPDVKDFRTGRFHFALKPQGKYVTNPSTWILETLISLRRGVTGHSGTTWETFNHPRTAKSGEEFVKLSLLANEYMISSIKVCFSDHKDLNVTTDLYRLRAKWMYTLKFPWEEKQDKKYIQQTHNRSGLLHNTGKIRTDNQAKLDVVVDHPEETWDSARSAMDLADEMLSKNQGKMPFPVGTQPLIF